MPCLKSLCFVINVLESVPRKPISFHMCPNRINSVDGLFTASLYSAYTVLKFMMMWTLVLLADFILEFRLEYLWPCWLFFGSVYTTFHCHGLVRTFAMISRGPVDDDNPTEIVSHFTEADVFFVSRLFA